MIVKSYISIAAIALGLAITSGASALEIENGLSVNGLSVNGLSVNGLSVNGLSVNGTEQSTVLSVKAAVVDSDQVQLATER